MRVFWLAILGGVMLGLWLFFGWSRARKQRKLKAGEVQKLLDLAAKEGTLTEAMVQAAIDMPKADAAAALAELRQQGFGELATDEHGAEVLRVNPAALEAKKEKGS